MVKTSEAAVQVPSASQVADSENKYEMDSDSLDLDLLLSTESDNE